MYPHIYEINPATRFYGKITGQYTVLLPYWFCAAENALCRSHSSVRRQFIHITTVLRTSKFTHVSPSSSMATKGHFSWYTFLNVWKHLLFAGGRFAGAQSIDPAMLSLEHKTFLQMALWFQRSIQLAALWMRCSLQWNFFGFVSFAHTQSISESKSAYFYLLHMCNASRSGFGKFQHKSFRAMFVCCCRFTNDKIQNFWEAICISWMPYWFWWFSGTNMVEL